MNIGQFRGSKTWSNDLASTLNDEVWTGSAGWVYPGGVCIQEHNGGWCLTIGNQQTLSDDLASLEDDLHRWATREELL